MSINWVMLDEQQNFIPLPKERILYTSPARTSFNLSTPNTFPGKTPLSIQSSTGKAYVTNQRFIYLPSHPQSTTGTPGAQGQLQSFTSPLLNLSDTHVTAPFFGPNSWVAVVKPVTGGGIPATHAFVELKLVFKDGGAFDFHSAFERVREQVLHVRDVAGEAGLSGHEVDGLMGNVGEELPAYEGPSAGGVTVGDRGSAPGYAVPSTMQGSGRRDLLDEDSPSPATGPIDSRQMPPPNGDPPGYEDVQASGVANSLEDSVRRQAS